MVLTHSFNEITEQPLIAAAQSFDYDTLDSETRIIVQQRTGEIKSLIRQTAQDIIDIGQKLTEVKQQLGHGNFRNWLKAEFEWGIWTATKFMQVANRFRCVKFTHLNIAASALYLLAAPSIPKLASEEALERANQGEFISYGKAKTIVNRCKEAAKLNKTPKPVTVDVSIEPYPALQTVESQSTAVAEQSEDKPLGKETEALAHSQVSNRSDEMVLDTDCGKRSFKNQAKVDIHLLFGIGDLIYFTDMEQQESKLLGKVAEIKEMTATEMVIKISFCGSNGSV